MNAMASQIASLTQPFIQAQIKESINAPHHRPLCRNSAVTGEFPAQRASKAENVSIYDAIMFRNRLVVCWCPVGRVGILHYFMDCDMSRIPIFGKWDQMKAG